MRKQCLKNTDIHRQLMEKGLAVSYSGVCKYVRKKKSERASKGRDYFLRLSAKERVHRWDGALLVVKVGSSTQIPRTNI